MQLARTIRSGTFFASSEPALVATPSEITNLTHYQTELHYQWSGIRDRADRAGISGNKEVISVDRNSRGEEGLGRAALLIAEGVRINAT